MIRPPERNVQKYSPLLSTATPPTGHGATNWSPFTATRTNTFLLCKVKDPQQPVSRSSKGLLIHHVSPARKHRDQDAPD